MNKNILRLLVMAQLSNLEEKLLEQKRKAEEKDAERRAEKFGLSYLNLVSIKVPTELKAMRIVPEDEARRALLVPLQLVKKTFILAVFSPEKPETKEVIERLKVQFDVQLVVVSMSSLGHAWGYYKYIVSGTRGISGRVEINNERLIEIQDRVQSLVNLSELIADFKSSYTSQILEIILGGAISLNASDIHMEPERKKGLLRLRIDGLLHTVYTDFKQIVYRAVVTRIKLLSNLKINITDEPQDGRFTITLPNYAVEIRTSIIPSEYGETVVLRILDPSALKVNLRDLGWREDDLAIVLDEIKRPNGLILNTGPTGSGKTTTLYAFLRTVLTPEIKIITIEDPVEYHLEGISQTQVDLDAHYTFATGLRAILRQDPDVILVGEIRDDETADIALNASLTGHLVFSTLHTNDAVGAVPRFFDLGAKPHILGPALTLVIAQRLVRVLCGDCKKEKQVDADLKKKIYAFLENLPKRVDREKYKNFKLFEPGVSCSKCRNLGFKGRVALFELFRVDEKMETLIYQNPTEIDLKKQSRAQGFVTMQEDGLLKVLQGITDFSEVERMTGKIEF